MADKEQKIDMKETETEEDKKAREKEEKIAKEEEKRKKKLEDRVVKDGDMIFIDILGKTLEEDSENNMVFQASNPKDAKLLPNYDPKKKGQYLPELVIVGKQGFLQDKIVEILKDGIKYFEEKSVKLDPKDAFGAREGKKIEKISQKRFIKDMEGEKPYPGAIYKDKKGRQGTVLRANQGRLLVDFNHPLAGKRVEYTVQIIDKIEGFENQTKSLLARRLGGNDEMANKFIINHDKDSKTLEIEIPQMVMFQLAQQQGGVYFKMGVSMDLQENLPNTDIVKFVEVFKKTPPPVPEHDHENEHEHDNEDEEKETEKTEEKKEKSEKTEEKKEK